MYPEAYFGVVLALSLLATQSVILRFVARLKKRTAFGWDDCWMAIAWSFLVGLNINAGLLYLKGRLGQPITESMDSLSVAERARVSFFLKSFYTSTILYFFCMLPVKLSILSMYARIWHIGIFKLAIRMVVGLCILWALGGLLSTIMECVPPARTYDRSIPGQCMDPGKLFRGITISNLLTDSIVLAVPLIAIRTLKLDRRSRLALTFLFMMGGLTCVVVLLRIIYQERLRNADLSSSLGDCALWTIAEPAVAILAANLPCLKPLIPTGSPLTKFVDALSSKTTPISSYPTSNSSKLRRSWYGSPKQGTTTTTATGGEDDGHPLNPVINTYDNNICGFYEQEFAELEQYGRSSQSTQVGSSISGIIRDLQIPSGHISDKVERPPSGDRVLQPQPMGILVQKEFSIKESPALDQSAK